MELEDEDEDNDWMSDGGDQDDSSWRVRRGAMFVIETLLKSNNDQINHIYETCISP